MLPMCTATSQWQHACECVWQAMGFGRGASKAAAEAHLHSAARCRRTKGAADAPAGWTALASQRSRPGAPGFRDRRVSDTSTFEMGFCKTMPHTRHLLSIIGPADSPEARFGVQHRPKTASAVSLQKLPSSVHTTVTLSYRAWKQNNRSRVQCCKQKSSSARIIRSGVALFSTECTASC